MEDTMTLYPNTTIRANSGIPSKVGHHLLMTEVEVNFSDLSKVSRNRVSRFLRQGYIDGGYASVPAELAEFIFKHTRTPYMRYRSQSENSYLLWMDGFDHKSSAYDEMFNEIDAYAKTVALLSHDPLAREVLQQESLVAGRKRQKIVTKWGAYESGPYNHAQVTLFGAKDHMDVIAPLFRQHVWRPLGIDPAKRFASY